MIHRDDWGWDRVDVVGLAGIGSGIPNVATSVGAGKGEDKSQGRGKASKSVRPSAGDALVRRRPATRAPGRSVVRASPPDKVPDELIRTHNLAPN